MKILLKNATIINEKSEFHNETLDILIENGIVSQIKKDIDIDADSIINKKDLHVSSGWFDPNISFGEPGFELRETLENGLLTACKSGFTNILINPNTDPPISSHADVSHLLQKSKSSPTALHISASLSENGEGKNMASLYDLHKAGSKAFGDFNSVLKNSSLLRVALEYVQAFNGIIQAYPIDEIFYEKGQMHEGLTCVNLGLKGIPTIAETNPLSRDLSLLEYTNGKMHIPYISSERGVKLIRDAKKRGLNVSCCVGIPHLLFTDENLLEFDTDFKIIPPLRNSNDQKALREGLLDGTIDMISSLHQPVNPELKNLEFVQSKEGSIGMEAAFKVMHECFPLDKIITFFTRGKKRFGIEDFCFKIGSSADITLFTPYGKDTFKIEDIKSTSKNCMFIGTETKGEIYGIIRGEKIHLN